jgi:prepilin-type N-terminal cleavage/methylation domain-containing protein
MLVKIKNQKSKIKNGFTLIELLVVISIVGILAAIATTSYSSAQKQARDTTRKSDLAQYRTSLEGFANKNNGLYPAYNSKRPASVYLCAPLGLTCPSSEDPKNGTDPDNYYYNYQSNGGVADGTAKATEYIIWAKLENVSASYWVVCSTGKSGVVTLASGLLPPTTDSGACPI